MPEKRRENIKNHLPEIMSSNVGVTKRFWKDLAKKKKSREKLTYHQIGIVDGTTRSEFSNDKFSIESKMRSIQRSASAKKIESLRYQYEKLLGTPKTKPVESAADLKKGAPGGRLPPATEDQSFRKVSHPFTNDNCDSQISLSLYNRPKSLASTRPRGGRKPEDWLT